MKHKSIAHRVQSGELSASAFDAVLATYQGQRRELVVESYRYSPEVYRSRMRDITLAIGIAQVFVNNFSSIKRGK